MVAVAQKRAEEGRLRDRRNYRNLTTIRKEAKTPIRRVTPKHKSKQTTKKSYEKSTRGSLRFYLTKGTRNNLIAIGMKKL